MAGPKRAKTGGRRALISLESVVAAGRRIGLVDLTVARVAIELGVSAAAVYRHVSSRLELERLVGEAVLDDLVLADDPAAGTAAHLVGFAGQLRRFTLDHPGTADYLRLLFPRGGSGRRLLDAEVAALGRRGYAPAAAVALSGAVASLALGLTATDEARAHRAAGEPEQAQREIDEAISGLAADPVLGAARSGLPEVGPDEFFRIVMTAAVDGLIAHLPPGRPVAELLSPP